MSTAPLQSPIKNLLRTNLLNNPADRLKFHLKLLRWILSSGRYIVIFVEMIVIGAFVYRYKLDADLVALQEEITQQSAYVQSLKNDEDVIRLTQFQLSSIKTTKDSALDISSILTKIAKYTPQNIRITTISIDNSKPQNKVTLNISGTTASNKELSLFLKLLQSDQSMENITLSNISFEGQTNFTISGNVKRSREGTI